MATLSFHLCVFLIILVKAWASVGPQSGYQFQGFQISGQFDYRIQIFNGEYLKEIMEISEDSSQYQTIYSMDDKAYDVELWKDCSNPSPVGKNKFKLFGCFILLHGHFFSFVTHRFNNCS